MLTEVIEKACSRCKLILPAASQEAAERLTALLTGACGEGHAAMDDLRLLIAASTAAKADAGDLTPKQIEAGWHQTFSTSNPFCPCDLKTFTKAVRWAERAMTNGGMG